MLRSFVFLTSLAASVATADDRPKYVPGRYIIQLKPGADAGAVTAHHEAVKRLARSASAPKKANAFEKRYGTCGAIVTVTATVTENAPAPTTPASTTPGDDIKECVKRTFTVGHGNFHAYVGNFDEEFVKEIEKLDDVVSVEPDEYIYLPGDWPIAGDNPYPVAHESSPSSSAGYAQSTPGSGHGNGTGYASPSGSGYAIPSGSGSYGGSAHQSGSISTPGSAYQTGAPVIPSAEYPTNGYPVNGTLSKMPFATGTGIHASSTPSGTATPSIPSTNVTLPSNSSLTTESNTIWSLADLSHKNGVSNSSGYSYLYDATAGAGQTAYVFDTGIRSTHSEFEGRVRFGINALTNSTTSAADGNNDGTGHGTHVAGTLGGKTYGVAKKVQLVDVKVFDTGSATMSSILAGLDWAFQDVQLQGTLETAVFSMSFGARTSSTALDAAIKALYDFGILTVVAAGNENKEIGNTSPARLAESFTVGYTNQQRQRVDSSAGVLGSNYGPELDVWAPGYEITSAGFASDTAVLTESGTSMATPLVAGLVCYLRALEGLGTPKAVTERILALGEQGVVGDVKGSKNVLVYNGSGQ